jgi:hypothetical protein
MGTQQKNRKSHKTDALMRLLMSGSTGTVNPSVSVSFKEDVIRPINDKKSKPKAAEPQTYNEPPENIIRHHMPPVQEKPQSTVIPREQTSAAITPPEQTSVIIPPPVRDNIITQRINPDKPAEMDIVRELIKELLPTAIQRFNVCYCDTCYHAMTEAVLRRSPKIIIMITSKDDLSRAEYLKKQNRNNVLRTVIKEVLDYKTTGIHNNILMK